MVDGTPGTAGRPGIAEPGIDEMFGTGGRPSDTPHPATDDAGGAGIRPVDCLSTVVGPRSRQPTTVIVELGFCVESCAADVPETTEIAIDPSTAAKEALRIMSMMESSRRRLTVQSGDRQVVVGPMLGRRAATS
jgi:hypothetical protein